jgi:hypothetical protein
MKNLTTETVNLKSRSKPSIIMQDTNCPLAEQIVSTRSKEKGEKEGYYTNNQRTLIQNHLKPMA